MHSRRYFSTRIYSGDNLTVRVQGVAFCIYHYSAQRRVRCRGNLDYAFLGVHIAFKDLLHGHLAEIVDYGAAYAEDGFRQFVLVQARIFQEFLTFRCKQFRPLIKEGGNHRYAAAGALDADGWLILYVSLVHILERSAESLGNRKAVALEIGRVI